MKETAYVHALELLTEGASAECVNYYDQFPLEEFQAHERRYRPLVHSAGIVGLGVGEREVGGNLTDDLALRFYVRKKLPKNKCRSLIPKQIETSGPGLVYTDVVEIGELRHHALRKEAQKPAQPGCSVGIGLVAGTLGCLVKKRGANAGQYMLTNSHVIACDGMAELNTPVYQPARVDTAKPSLNAFAELSEVVPFKFSRNEYNNLVDAAIARIKQADMADSAIIGIAHTGGIVDATRGMAVQKSGRSSEITHGKVRDIHFKTWMKYQKDKLGNIGRVGFTDQILVTKFSQDGDSGALVLNEQGMAVGLLFAGSDRISVCNKIQNVLELLNVDLV